jgi:hypothetical protein
MERLGIEISDRPIEDVLKQAENHVSESELRAMHSEIMWAANAMPSKTRMYAHGVVANWLLGAAECLHQDGDDHSTYRAYRHLIISSWETNSKNLETLVEMTRRNRMRKAQSAVQSPALEVE